MNNKVDSLKVSGDRHFAKVEWTTVVQKKLYVVNDPNSSFEECLEPEQFGGSAEIRRHTYNEDLVEITTTSISGNLTRISIPFDAFKVLIDAAGSGKTDILGP